MKKLLKKIKRLLNKKKKENKLATERPHIINIDSTAITASSDATDTFEVGSNEEYQINEIRVVAATDIFDLEISDQAGFAYQNEKVRFAAPGGNPNEFNIYKLNPPLMMAAATKFSFKFTDASGNANRVRLQLIGKRTLA